MILCLLASEIQAVTGLSPSEHYKKLTEKFGEPSYKRVDAPADLQQKARLSKLAASDVTATSLAGEKISDVEFAAPGGGALGGIKVSTQSSWFAARPSGTENVYKIYGESFKGAEHLEQVLSEAQLLVDSVVAGE